MLTSALVTTSVATREKAHIFWEDKIEFKLDCFICQRTDRTVIIDRGSHSGRCVSARKPPGSLPPGMYSYDQVSYQHPAPIRVAAFDWWQERTPDHGERLWLRCRLDFWWAQFSDRKRTTPAIAPANHPWIRLHYHAGCRLCHSDGHQDALNTPGTRSLQTNMIFPVSTACPTCQRSLATIHQPPEITLAAT